ncbi:NUDIX hydrolase [Kitasatospora sp. MBT63]|uniref:NUDIX hydrolase n=1 Tax=Kitasatospora sp. MBT63 TaxID=1444768 RepID=UPI00068B1F71|nr:NUDIX domain-containing protein [Kitasatospora sp. MBT63]
MRIPRLRPNRLVRRRPRQAARTAVLDPQGWVFLLRSDNSEVGVHWNMPGGGLEEDESPQDGARRELHEETGWTDLAPGPLLCTWEHDFTWHGIPVRQHEHIFLGRGPRRQPAGDLSAVHRTDGILDWRWWSPAELARADAGPFWPPNLPALLDTVRPDWSNGLAPTEPVHLGYVPNGPPRGR